MEGFKTVYIADPQDFSRGQGGFQGGFFRVAGVTDRDFDSSDSICAVMNRRKQWRKIKPISGFDALYQWHDGRSKFLGITFTVRRVS